MRASEREVFGWLSLVAVGWLVVIPLFLVIFCSFQREPLFEVTGPTIQNYLDIYIDPATYQLILNTLFFGAGAILVGFVFAIPLAWLVERTNAPGRHWMYALILVPMALPPMIAALGWERLLDPRIGVINMVLRAMLGMEGEGPLNVYTLYGMSFVMGLSMVPTVFLMLVPVLRNMDPAFEEASMISGASRFMTLMRVTFPLTYPAFFAALIWFFIISIEAFEIPGVIGMQAGILVFSTKIFYAIHPPTGELPEYGTASALAMAVLVLSGVLVYLYLKVLGAGEKYTTVTGRGYRPSIMDLGRARYLGSLFFFLYLSLAVVFPLVVLGWGSLLTYYQPPSWELVSQLTMKHYYNALTGYGAITAFKNTAMLVVVAATVTTLLSVTAGWIIVRSGGRMGRALNLLTFAPIAIPSVIIGFALILVYLSIPVGIYGTIWVIAIAHVTRFIAYGSRAVISAQVQVHKELEEASYTCGGSMLVTLRKVVVPIVLPALVSLWLWVALHSLRELSSAVLLASPGNRVVSTMIWFAWQEGQVGEAYAISIMLIAVSLVIAFAARRLLTWGDPMAMH
jgi:iron(III) transport system permease protein